MQDEVDMIEAVTSNDMVACSKKRTKKSTKTKAIYLTGEVNMIEAVTSNGTVACSKKRSKKSTETTAIDLTGDW